MSMSTKVTDSLSYPDFVKGRESGGLESDAKILMGKDGKGIKIGERLGFVDNIPEIYSDKFGTDLQDLSRWAWSKFAPKSIRVIKGIEVSQMALKWTKQYVEKVEKVESVIATSFEHLEASYTTLGYHAASMAYHSVRQGTGSRNEKLIIANNFYNAAELIRTKLQPKAEKSDEVEVKIRRAQLEGVMFRDSADEAISFEESKPK